MVTLDEDLSNALRRDWRTASLDECDRVMLGALGVNVRVLYTSVFALGVFLAASWLAERPRHQITGARPG